MFARAARVAAAAVLTVATAAGYAATAANVTSVAPAAAAAVAQDAPVKATGVVSYNDPRRAQQWAVTRLAGEQLRAKASARGIVVAVIDSGVQASHPDLRGRVITGWDFTTNKPGGTVDGYGHGTHVAGIIAANANNRTGVAGFAPDATIMPLRVLDNNGAGMASSVAKALVYAADHGAKVANVSLASSYTQTLANAVAYAQSKGLIIVASVGNDRQQGNKATYPAALPGVIGVAADDSASRSASFSNTGSYVDVTAPGVSILSTYKGSSYALMSGTSMASPYVTASIAVLAAAKHGITANQALAALTRTAKDLGARGKDAYYGAGEIRPLAAVCTVRAC